MADTGRPGGMGGGAGGVQYSGGISDVRGGPQSMPGNASGRQTPPDLVNVQATLTDMGFDILAAKMGMPGGEGLAEQVMRVGEVSGGDANLAKKYFTELQNSVLARDEAIQMELQRGFPGSKYNSGAGGNAGGMTTGSLDPSEGIYDKGGV